MDEAINAIKRKIREYESDAEIAIQERDGYGADDLFGKVAGLTEALEIIMTASMPCTHS